MSMRSRAITVLASAACAAALVGQALVTEAQDALPKARGKGPVAKPAPAAPKEGEFTDALTLPTDRKARKSLEAAEDYIREADWASATHILQNLLNSKEDLFVEVKRTTDGRETSQWTSIRFEANRLLGTMPTHGLQVYELQFGGKARDLLAEARKAPDARGSDDLKNQSTVEILADVAQRFLHTKAGSEAAELLGTYYLDRGQPVMATLCFERLLGRKGAVPSPLVLLKATLAFRRLGDQANADQAWQRLAKAFPAGVPLGGRTVPLDDLQKEVDRLHHSEALVNAYDWLMFKGNPSRSAQGIGGTPFLDEQDNRWEQPTQQNAKIKAMVQEGVNYQESHQLATIPGFFPIAAGGKLVFRSYQGIQAVDFRTGKLVWEQIATWSPDQLVTDGNFAHQVGLWLPAYSSTHMQHVLFENSMVGTLSTDNSLVFAVDDLTLPPHPQLMQNFQMGMGGGKPNFQRLDEAVHCNQLMAIELDSGKLKWQVGGRGDPAKNENGPLNECYFLGPPLPLGGRLYTMIEKNSELRLVCLQAATGELSWAQTLASVRDRLLSDIGRRTQAVNLAYSDGILVCPTNAGAIIGVDLLTHSLAWAKPYREAAADGASQPDANMRLQMQMMRRGGMFPGQQFNQRQASGHDWKCSSPVIQDGKVVFTAPDGNSLYCLNLRDGDTIWKAPRGDDLYLAGVFDGKVLLVGKQNTRALNLADGKQLWSRELGMPSGYGTASNKVYYLPLKAPTQGKDPEVCAIDIATGRVISHAKSTKKQVPGNLVFYEGRVISQTVDKVAAYPLLSLKLAEMNERIRKNPHDPIGLTERAEMRRHNGEVASAVEDLHVALANRPDEKTTGRARQLLFESLTELFQKDFNAGEKYLDEYKEMCKVSPAGTSAEAKQQAEDEQQRRQANFLCLVAKGKESQGKLVEAFQYYRDFGSLRDRTGLLTVVDEPAVKAAPDLWAQGRIAAMMAKATPAQRKPLEDEIARQWQSLRESSDAAQLRSFVTLFGAFSDLGKEARLRLAERLMDDHAFVEAELQALQVQRQENKELAARAVELLARLCTRKGLLEDAAYWYRLLARDYAQVQVIDGKTGAELYSDLATDKRFLPYLDESPALWGRGKIKSKQEQYTAQPADRTLLFEPDGEQLPFHRRNRLGVAQSARPGLVLMDRTSGEERWTHAVQRANPNQFNMNQLFQQGRSGRYTYFVEGHLAIFTLGNTVYGIDLSEPKILWERNLSGLEAGYHVVANPLGGLNVVYPDGRAEKLGQTGPVEPSYVCVQSRQGLTVLDPLQGNVLWTRADVPSGSVVFGDRDLLFIMEVAANGALGVGRAVRAHDGVAVDVPDFAEQYKHKVAVVGRTLLVLDTVARGKVLRLYDVPSGKDVWKKELPANVILLQSEEPTLAGVVEPAPSGRLTVVDLVARKEVLHGNIDPKDLNGIHGGHLFRDQNLIYVGLNSTNQPANANVLMNNGLAFANNANVVRTANLQNGMRWVMLNGWFYAFDRGNGKLKWKNEVNNQALVLDQFQELPILLFSAQQLARMNGTSSASAKSIDKRTGKLLFEKDLQNSVWFTALRVNPREGTIDLLGQNTKIHHYIETR